MVASNVRRDQFNLEESILGINQAPRMEEGNRVEVSFPRLSVTQIGLQTQSLTFGQVLLTKVKSGL